MSFKTYAWLCLSLVMANFQTSNAQQKDTLYCATACCGGNDATPAGVMINRVHSKNEWMFSYKFMTMNMGGLMHGNQSITKESVFANYLMAPKSMNMNMHMIMGMYGITNRLTVMVMVNYNVLSMQMDMYAKGGHHHAGNTETSNSHRMESSGLGDLKAYALYGLLNTSNHQLLVSGGLNIPTGSILINGNADDMMYPNTRLPYSMQLGSGTFDILPCINYVYQHHKWTASSQVSAVLRTGKNAVGYRLGNEFTSSSWLAYQWLSFLSSSVRLEGALAKNITGKDATQYRYNEPSSDTDNYGGRKMTGYLGSVFHITKGALKNTGIAAEYGIPIYQYFSGVQMRNQRTVSLSIQYGF
jgi:hypothetical protein